MKVKKTTAIERFVDWYINRYYPEDFLRRPQLHSALVIAKENEASRINKIRDRKEQELIDSLTREFESERDELRAEITRIGLEIEDYKKQIKEVETIRLKTIRRAKVNMRLSTDIVYQSKRLEKTVNEITGLFEGIKEHAEEHVEMIEKVDDQERKKLGYNR